MYTWPNVCHSPREYTVVQTVTEAHSRAFYCLLPISFLAWLSITQGFSGYQHQECHVRNMEFSKTPQRTRSNSEVIENDTANQVMTMIYKRCPLLLHGVHRWVLLVYQCTRMPLLPSRVIFMGQMIAVFPPRDSVHKLLITVQLVMTSPGIL